MTAALSLSRVSRRFGIVQALHEVDLRFEPGQVHAVLGENGAGKSTAIRILAGLDQPDSGTVELDGVPVDFRSRAASIRSGIGLIPQNGSLIAELTLAQNLALTRPEAVLRHRRLRAVLEEAAASIGVMVEVGTPVRRMGRAQQQLGELVLAAAQGARILLLDEPTSVLDATEIRGLYGRLRRFAEAGMTVMLITHRLSEVRAVADVATVLSHGEVAWTGPVAGVSDAELARAMVGELPPDPPAQPARALPGAATVLNLRDIAATTDDLAPIRDVNMDVRAGEVVAVIGTAGSGQRALAEVAAGVIVPARGTRTTTGQVAYVPENRDRVLLSALPVRWSAVLARLKEPRFTRFGMLRTDEVTAFARALLTRYDVRPPDPELPAGALSGGNAQKLVVGRELDSAPAVAVLHAPTQGLDLRAARAVRAIILDAAAAGTGILLVSADHEEARALAHRILVLREGRIAGEYTATAYDHAVHQLVEVPTSGGRPAC
ncbi:ATP-binding cassette domain-containing protein [Amycolatopsis sp. NPDC051758]|uniref:ATP-binding cassette domain-containing protein n=1 Tax=Amycolatopsis sp. NPDC051758 TaxID=3363935 RepID=UPI0037B30212